MKLLPTAIVSLSLVCMASCNESSTPKGTNAPVQNWEKVEQAWSVAAELSRYELQQNRYGVIREGEAMLIYVREPFHKDKQVKDESGKGDFQVLKLNATREFRTGLYPYHTMVSVFQPLEESGVGKALKVTTSVQDWCGHVFMQSNRRDGSITTQVKSYFEQEDEGEFEETASTLLEDEVWTALRIHPAGLPTGNINMIPGSIATRFSHSPPTMRPAHAQWLEGGSDQTKVYEITYLRREKRIEATREAWIEVSFCAARLISID